MRSTGDSSAADATCACSVPGKRGFTGASRRHMDIPPASSTAGGGRFRNRLQTPLPANGIQGDAAPRASSKPGWLYSTLPEACQTLHSRAGHVPAVCAGRTFNIICIMRHFGDRHAGAVRRHARHIGRDSSVSPTGRNSWVRQRGPTLPLPCGATARAPPARERFGARRALRKPAGARAGAASPRAVACPDGRAPS